MFNTRANYFYFLFVLVIDAMGKPHSGVLNGHLSWIGGFDECIAITAMVNTSNEISHPFKGRYCLATFAQPAVNIQK